MTRTRPVLGLAALLVTSAALAGCGGDDDLGDDDTGGGGYSVEGALRDLPPLSDDGFVTVRTADLAGAAELGEVPSAADDAGAWFSALIAPPLLTPMPPSVAQFAFPVDEPGPAGFAFSDVDSFVTSEDLGGGDSRRIEVFRVADGVEAEEGDEVRVDGDLAAVSDDESVLDDWEGDGSAADDVDLRAVAAALDDRDVFAALLSHVSERAGSTDLPDFTAVGIGRALDDGAPVEHVAYAVEDPEAAAAAFQAAWEGEESVDEVEVEAADGVVVVRVTPADPEVPFGPALALLEQGGAPYVS